MRTLPPNFNFLASRYRNCFYSAWAIDSIAPPGPPFPFLSILRPYRLYHFYLYLPILPLQPIYRPWHFYHSYYHAPIEAAARIRAQIAPIYFPLEQAKFVKRYNRQDAKQIRLATGALAVSHLVPTSLPLLRNYWFSHFQSHQFSPLVVLTFYHFSPHRFYHFKPILPIYRTFLLCHFTDRVNFRPIRIQRNRQGRKINKNGNGRPGGFALSSYQFALLAQLSILPFSPFVSNFGPGGFNIFYHFPSIPVLPKVDSGGKKWQNRQVRYIGKIG